MSLCSEIKHKDIMTLPPIAKKIPTTTKNHGHEIADYYAWMRDPSWPKVQDKHVLEYLQDENKYTESFFKANEEFTDKIYQELIGRIKLEDRSVPIKDKNYFYFNVTKETSNYAIHFRHDAQGKEQILLDENEEAAQHSYYRVGTISINPSENLMAYSFDNTGDEYYTARIKDLSTNQLLPDILKDTIGSLVWSESGKGFYYVKVDDKWRPTKMYFHKLGTDQSEDKMIYHEQDPVFRIDLDKTSDDKYIIVETSSSTSCELHYIDATDLSHKLNMLIPRREDHLCDVDHWGDKFYIYTNDKGKNFRLVAVSDKSPIQENYDEIIPHNEDIYLLGFAFYDEHFIIETREVGLPKIQVFDYNLTIQDVLTFPDPTYNSSLIYSDHDDDGLMIHYSSMVSPSTVFKYDFKTKELRTLKVQEIPSGYNKSEYASERLMVQSREDGIKIPVSLVYKKSLFNRDGSNPLFLYGYGSYGIAIPASFSSTIFSLLDRGFVYAIAHIRGGDDLGFKWYESAKFLTKRRTFDDFIDVAKHMISAKYTTSGNIAIAGGSAGGMLVGNVINQEPDLFHAAIADVPFVDVLSTMLDDTLPLTPKEFEEWGNPKEPEYFGYIKSYSPYDNVSAQRYPNLYVLAGLNDVRVTYWEPAKWVAKLRDMKIDSNLLMLETEMESGHGGKSGRFHKFKEIARKYVFILKMFNINK